jgi:hypothetical protein
MKKLSKNYKYKVKVEIIVVENVLGLQLIYNL